MYRPKNRKFLFHFIGHVLALMYYVYRPGRLLDLSDGLTHAHRESGLHRHIRWKQWLRRYGGFESVKKPVLLAGAS